ncbi:MAG: undecaprenyl/decaprenyl-phosphate alpha-N-acetylglucosaminyl 1-phosphate transferase [Betaproteobacteria bacterium]|nr:undecaprenyl/decaprenyl-phosphate alpha-N-acetylglucosaminyl 1-phosphate transferase [Betaproteobacteria bacterium]
MTPPLLTVLGSLAISFIACWLLMRVAAPIGLIDHPGGRKDHAHAIPLVGGLAIYFTLLIGWLSGFIALDSAMLLALTLVLIIGVADDIREIGPKPKTIMQALAVLVMVFSAGVILKSVGNLIGLGPIGMSIFAIPMTVFAALGVINAINMVDGMDGLAGTLSFIAVTAYAYVAHLSGLTTQLSVLLALAGALVGFLLLNMRLPWQARARLFLGDTGSMLLGFILAWFAIDLTHGPGRSFPPICALWVIVLPLCDCVSLMLRRIGAGKSPFVADRQHLHHLMLDHYQSVPKAHAVISILSLLTAAVGIVGWQYQVPEPILFVGFVALFIGYHIAMKRAFRHRDVNNTGLQAAPAVTHPPQ